eukprot:scaffold5650_cov206-Chaetoceros_neogracile.AAC.2
MALHSDHQMATNSAPPMDHSMGVPMAQPMALHSDHPMAVGLVMMMEAPKVPSMSLHWDRPMATNLDRPMVRLMALMKVCLLV